MNWIDAARKAIDKCHSLKYTSDGPNDVWKDPKRTLLEGEGDCIPLSSKLICLDRQTGFYCMPRLSELQSQFSRYLALSYNFADRAWQFKQILQFTPKGMLPVFQVRLKNGQEFAATSKHRVWEIRNGKREEIRVEDLQKGSRLCVASRLPSLDLPYSSSLAYLDGIYAAEGYQKEKGKGGVQIAQDKLLIRQRIEAQLIAEGIKYTPSKRSIHASYYIPSGPTAQHFLSTGTNSFDKSLPFSALSADTHAVQCLVQGHADGDAYIPKLCSPVLKRLTAVHGTSSNTLKETLSLALWILGERFHVWLQEHHKGAGKHPIWRITRWKNPAKSIEGYPGLGVSSVKSITSLGLQEVADVAIADTKNFLLSSGVLVHNCEDFAVLFITLAEAWCDSPKPRFRLVIGDTPNGRHAWASITIEGIEKWCDPTPGYDSGIASPSAWNRSPLYAYVYRAPLFLDKEQWKA
jgi:hypothetical protein